MALPARKEETYYTFADYLEWDEDVRAEIINGEVFMMPSPTRWHQQAAGELFVSLYNFLKGKKCKPFIAPFDVRPFEKDGDKPHDIDVVLEPDVFVVCDPEKITDNGCKGAPDLVIEILSPSTQSRDRVQKFLIYQKAGVQEYWIVNPMDQTVQVYTLEDGHFVPRESYNRTDTAKFHILDGCSVELTDVFPEE